MNSNTKTPIFFEDTNLLDRDEKKITIDTNNALTLCYIIDNYEKLIESYEKMLDKSLYDKDFISMAIHKLLLGKPFFETQLKMFYNENKEIIDTINEHSNIETFFGKDYHTQDLNKFYNYLIRNKEQLSNITNVLLRIKQLGFISFILDEEADFTKRTDFVTYDKVDYYIYYYDNIKCHVRYDSEILRYQTNGSSFIIGVKFHEDTEVQNITLNTLAFDPDRLPEEVSFSSLFDKIMQTKHQLDNEFNMVNTAIDLTLIADDLSAIMNRTYELIDNKSCDKTNDEQLKLLTSLKNNLENIQSISSQYAHLATTKGIISPDVLENDKRLARILKFNR